MFLTDMILKRGIQASISRVINYAFIIIGLLITLDYLGINMRTLAALSAVLMVGIGFGLQNITSNFISGLILLFERPIQVGDFIDVTGIFGKVTAINARSTTVTTIDNIAMIVPNSHFISESLTNWSYKRSAHPPSHTGWSFIWSGCGTCKKNITGSR